MSHFVSPLASCYVQRYNADNPKQAKRSPPLPDPSKGRRAFLTTEPTTYSPGAHGKPAFKECYRVRELERKRPKTSKNHQKKCFSSLRAQEAIASNPTTRTKNPLFSWENSGFFFLLIAKSLIKNFVSKTDHKNTTSGFPVWSLKGCLFSQGSTLLLVSRRGLW